MADANELRSAASALESLTFPIAIPYRLVAGQSGLATRERNIMTRNFKVLGLAITAVLAMSAVWAMSAQAAVPSIECTPEAGRNVCTVTGREINTHTFTVQRGNVRCASTFHATINRNVTSVSRVRATYTGCRAYGVAANVNMGTCTYTMTSTEDAEHKATVDVVCPEAGSIIIDAPSIPCRITVGPQTGLRHIAFTNEGNEPTDVKAKITVSGIVYHNLDNTCPGGRGTFNDGIYNGESTLEAFNDNNPNVEGNKVGLHVRT